MGRWGDGLFQGDYDLDAAGDISRDAGMELWSYWATDDPEIHALGLETTRNELNEGVFDELFEKYKAKGNLSGLWGANHLLVILVVLAMRIGATISEAQIDYTRSIHRHGAGLLDGGLKQVSQALKDYKNEPYNFKIKGLEETTEELFATKIYPYNQLGLSDHVQAYVSTCHNMVSTNGP